MADLCPAASSISIFIELKKTLHYLQPLWHHHKAVLLFVGPSNIIQWVIF